MYDMKNKTCPECGTKFHACSSCGLIHDYEYNYCCEECYKKSLTYEEKKNRIKDLMRQSFNNIYALEDLAIYLYETIDDETSIFLADEEIRNVWHREDI